MASCYNNTPSYSGCTSIFGCSGLSGTCGCGGMRVCYGSTGPTGPAGPTGTTGPTGPTGPTGATGATGPAGADAVSAYAQFGTTATQQSNNEALPITALITDSTGNIGLSTNTITLTAGRYLVSYHIRADGTTSGTYGATPTLNGVSLPLYAAVGTVTSGDADSTGATFIVDALAASTLQLLAAVSPAMSLSNSVTVLKLS